MSLVFISGIHPRKETIKSRTQGNVSLLSMKHIDFDNMVERAEAPRCHVGNFTSAITLN